MRHAIVDALRASTAMLCALQGSLTGGLCYSEQNLTSLLLLLLLPPLLFPLQVEDQLHCEPGDCDRHNCTLAGAPALHLYRRNPAQAGHVLSDRSSPEYKRMSG
jgi:hypothetical protein